jgi:hypothetical protein
MNGQSAADPEAQAREWRLLFNLVNVARWIASCRERAARRAITVRRYAEMGAWPVRGRRSADCHRRPKTLWAQ